MLTSRHWPAGATFLNAVDTLAATVCPNPKRGDANRVFGRYTARRRLSSSLAGEHFAIEARVPLPDTLTNHQRMSIAGLHASMIEEAKRFLTSCAQLPGVGVHGLVPWFCFDFIGGRTTAEQGHLTLESQHHTPYPLETLGEPQPLGVIGRTHSFAQTAQHLLDLVDGLCDHAPRPDAPVWHAFLPHNPKAAYHNKRAPQVGGLVSAGGVFQANSENDARTLVVLLNALPSSARDHLVLFSTTDEGARAHLATSTAGLSMQGTTLVL